MAAESGNLELHKLPVLEGDFNGEEDMVSKTSS